MQVGVGGGRGFGVGDGVGFGVGVGVGFGGREQNFLCMYGEY